MSLNLGGSSSPLNASSARTDAKFGGEAALVVIARGAADPLYK